MISYAALAVASILLAPSATGQFVPGDEYYHSGGAHGGQWGLHDIRMEEAWAITTGSDDVIVAVVDTRADLSHPDLQAALWEDPDRLPGDPLRHGVYIHGPGDDDRSSPDLPLINPPSHGTSVASIILARTAGPPQTAGTGMAGVAGGRPGPPGPRWMVLAIPTGGIEAPDYIAAAINYAVDHGADVINVSIGSCYNRQAVQDAVQRADGEGVVVVASSGNQTPVGASPPCVDDQVKYPAAYPEVIAVGATLESGARWQDSEPNIHPGTGPFSYLMAPGGEDVTAADPTRSSDYTFEFGGTSAAAPHVAGVVALIQSLYPRDDGVVLPRLRRSGPSPAQIAGLLTATADPAGCTEVEAHLTYVEECGPGRLDAYAALKLAIETYGGTFADDLVIPAGETWDLGAVTLAFAPGKRLVVEGTLNAAGTTFTASAPLSGWGGLRFENGSAGHLANAVVERVRGYGGASVYADRADLVIDNSRITLGQTAGSALYGVHATGYRYGAGVYVQNSSVIEAHPAGGVRASNGARVHVLNGVQITNVGGYGVYAANADAFVFDSHIHSVSGHGTAAHYLGSVSYGVPGGPLPPMASPNTVVEGVSGDDLRATSYATVQAGTTGASSFHGNSLLRGGTGRHAYGRTSGAVEAELDYWGNTSGPSLGHVDLDASSTFSYCPYLTAPGGSASACGGSGPPPKGGGLAMQAGSVTATPMGVVGHRPGADLAEAISVEETAPRTALRLAVRVAQATPDVAERHLALAVVGRIARRGSAPGAGALLDGLVRSAEGGAARFGSTPNDLPAALVVRSAVALARGDAAAAERDGAALVALGDGGRGHAVRALALVALGDPDRAERALEQAGAAADDAGELLAHARAILVGTGRPAAPASGAQVTTSESRERSTRLEPRLGPVRPNPAAGRAEVVLSLTEASAVEAAVYDVLGRRVAVLAGGPHGPGSQALRLAVEGLPPGAYVVRAHVRGAGGAVALSRAFTVVR